MELFSVSCTTCRARLKVRDPAAIHQILACPKCGSMVLVAPPQGWVMPEPAPLSATPDPALMSSVASGPWRTDSNEFGAALADAAGSGAGTSASAESLPPWPAWLPWACVPVAGVLSAIGVWVVLESSRGAAAHPATVSVAAAVVPSDPGSAPESVAGQAPASAPPPAVEPAPAAAPDSSLPAPPPTVPSAASQPAPPAAPSASPTAPDPFAPAAPIVSTAPPSRPAISIPPPPAALPAASAAAPPAAAPAPSPPPPPVPPEPELDPLPPVDVAARLADPLPAIEFRDVPLVQFLAFWSQASTVPVGWDLESLLDAGIRPSETISLAVRDTTLGEALAKVLGQRGLGYVVTERGVQVTLAAADPQSLHGVAYDVSDLVRDDAPGLVRMVRQLIEPASWAEVGGPATVAYEKGSLLVSQHPAAQRQVARFLDKLRVARGHSPRGKVDARRLSLDTRWSQARARLAAPLSLNFTAPAPLERIAAQVGARAGVELVFDAPALAAAGRRCDAPASIATRQQPLGEALDKLLTPLGLAALAVDERTLLVTSRAAARSRLELEFYRVDGLLGRGHSPEKLLAQAVAAAGQGGDARAAILFDAPGACLIVLQSQDAQRRIETALFQQP